MNWQFKLVNRFLRLVFRTVCRIDRREIDAIPHRGPLIIVCNHINFLEAPLLIPHIDDPNFIGVAKKESWNNPLFNYLFNLWGVISIDRDSIDREAFRKAQEALQAGKILVVFPEGTRSKDGKLLPGKSGVVAMIMRSGVPVLPVAMHGYEDFWENLKRLRKTDFHLEIGEPFRLEFNGELPSREERQAATDEIMYKIAELLPEQYRGHYQFNQAIQYRFTVAD